MHSRVLRILALVFIPIVIAGCDAPTEPGERLLTATKLTFEKGGAKTQKVEIQNGGLNPHGITELKMNPASPFKLSAEKVNCSQGGEIKGGETCVYNIELNPYVEKSTAFFEFRSTTTFISVEVISK